MNKQLMTVFAVTALLPATALAHDASMHKGKPTEGEVVAVEKGRFTLKAEDGTHPVTLGADTKVESGASAEHVKADLKVGEHVAVFGTKLPGGAIAAKEVVVGGGHAHDDGEDHDPQGVGPEPVYRDGRYYPAEERNW